jgi:hypothetical protein
VAAHVPGYHLCLVVDDFGIKVTDMAGFHHLKMSLEEYYNVAVD